MECLLCYKHVGEIAPTLAEPFTDFWRQFCNIIGVGVDDAGDLKAFENCQLCPDCFAVSTRAIEISTSIQQLQCELDGLSLKLNQSFEDSLTLERERSSCILNDDLLDDVKLHLVARSLLKKQKVPALEFVARLDDEDENARLEDEDEDFDVPEPEQRLKEEAFTADYEDGTNSVIIFTTNPEADDVQIEIVNESLMESVEVADKKQFWNVVQGHELKDFEIRLERLTDDFIARAEQGLVSFSSSLEEEISDGESGSISEGSLGSEWSNGENLDFSDSKKLKKRSEKLMCSCCGKFFEEMNVLMKHRKKAHPKGDEDFLSKCHGCGKIYKWKKSLRKHILGGHCDRSREKIAVSSSSTISRRSDGSVEASVEDMDDESMLEERQQIYPLNCASCDKVFESFKLLQSHNTDEHESRKQIIKCAVCTKVLSSLRSYRNHMKFHQNVLKSCDICDKQFLRQSYIEVHKQQMHSGSPECKRCGITFDSWELWTEHHRALHPETDKYKCSTCGKKCTSALSLTLHMRVHGERNCVCETCDARFANYPALHKHQKRVHGIPHSSGLVKKCDICEMDFDSRATLLEHKKDKHPLPKEALTCEKCGKYFASAYSLQTHAKTHEQKKYLCDYCNFGSMDRNELQKHQERMHLEGSDHVGDGRGKPKCRRCNINFTTWSDLATHRKESHPRSRKHKREVGIDRDEGSFQCELCGSIFSRQRYLEAHMMRHSGKTLFCEVCGKGFAESYELKRHSYTHSEKKPHTCELCGKGVIRLSSHHRMCLEKRNESEKEFRCTQCDKAFFLQASLKHHMKIHTNSDRLECEVCHKKFRSKCFLLVHHRTNHFPEEKLSCLLCPATFVRPCLLTWHNQYEHLGQRDKCTICGYEAKNRPAFTKHMKHHSLGRRFPCELCDKKFFSSDHLRRHQNTHSKRFENADIDNNQDYA